MWRVEIYSKLKRKIKIHGIKLWINSPLLISKLKWKLIKGRFGRNVLKIIRKYMKPKDIFIDIGAGMGVLSLAIKKEFNGRVLSFEADPAIYGLLLKNIKLNKLNIETYNYAVSDTKTPKVFHIFEKFDSSSLLERGGYKEKEKKEVQCITLDFIRDKIKSCQGNKVACIGIGGSEYDIRNDLWGFDYIIMEIHDKLLSQKQINGLIESLLKDYKIIGHEARKYIFENKWKRTSKNDSRRQKKIIE